MCGSLRVLSSITSSVLMNLDPTSEIQLPNHVQKSHLIITNTCNKMTELNKVLMLACGMGQREDGVTVGGRVSGSQL